MYWRVTAIDTEVDFSAIVDDSKPPGKHPRFGIDRVRLGLPLGLIAPSWAHLMPVKATQNRFKQPITASADGIFLPATEPEALIYSRVRTSVVVRELDKLENGQVAFDANTKLAISPAAMQVLLKHGEAYARCLDQSGKLVDMVPVILETDEIDVDAAREIPSQLNLTVTGRSQTLHIPDAERERLARGESVVFRHGSRAVRVRPRSMAARSITLRSPSLFDSLRGIPGGFVFRPGGPLRIFDPNDPPWGQPFRTMPRFEIGIATPIVQQWELLGYERGPMVGSVVLEPGAETLVEVFTWERLHIQRAEETGTTFERNAEVSALTRTTSRVSMDTATELGTTFNFGGGATIPIEAVEAKLEAGVETETAINTNVESGLERVNETTRKSAERFQATHQVKVVHTTERGSEMRSTRKIVNPNAGRTLQFLHFAIQERHRVTTGIGSKASLVAFVENWSLGPLDVKFIFAHEHVLKAALLSEDYRAGFDACRTIAAQAWFEESLAKKEKERAAAAAAAAASAAPEEAPVPGLPKTGIYQTARQIKELLQEFLDIDLGKEAQVLADNINPFVPDDEKPGKKRVKKAEARFSRWGFWEKFSMAYPGIDDKAEDFVKLKFDGEGHTSEEDMLAALQKLTDGLDDDWLSAIKMIAVAVIAGTAASIIGGPLSGLLQPILIAILLVSDDMGLPKAITRARQELQGERALQHGQTMMVAAPPAEEGETTGGGAALPPAPPQIVSDDVLATAHADYGKLRQHLEAHRSYYENAIWLAEDPSDRYVRLAAMGVAPFVENVIVGFVGNRAMYPLRLEALPETTQDKIKSIIGKPLKDGYEDIFPVKTEELVLPTPAVHCESYLGTCELLEPYLVRRRELDLVHREAVVMRSQAIAEQEHQKAARYAARLAHDPPLLDNPDEGARHFLPNGDEISDDGG